MGVDAFKDAVKIIEKLTLKSFPYAFTNVLRLGDRCVALHVDGAGSKPIIAYLAYKEYGDVKFFEGLSQDVMAMNLDDIIAAGVRPILFADYIAINPFRLDRSLVIGALASGFSNTFDMLKSLSGHSSFFTPYFIGGETADMPDQVRTMDVSGVVYGESDCNRIIDGSKINDGDIILGLSSYGRAVYERVENSGIMCNGLTLARHILLSDYYGERYPETFDIDNKFKYSGPYKLDSYVDNLGMTVMEALSSPTRIYTPIISEMLLLHNDHIHGMAHITGGGFTKILKVGFNANYVINFLPEPPPIFKLIHKHCGISLEEMYKVFNMGIGLVIIIDPMLLDDILRICDKYGIKSYILGRVERGFGGTNRLVVKSDLVKFEFVP